MKKNLAFYLPMAVFFCIAFVFGLPNIKILQDEQANKLFVDVISRIGFVGLLFLMIVFFGQKELFKFPLPFLPAFLFAIPCFLVALANFPYSAIVSGGATVTRTDLIPLFFLQCVLTGLSEEFLFRGILHTYIKRRFKEKKNGYFLSVLISSAIFGLWHLTNLIAGAGFGATALQVVYSFLIGAMLAVTLDKTGNVWLCAGIHALFNFGGLLIDSVGIGNAHDLVFWILTAVFGIICAIHILREVFKRNKSTAPEPFENN